MKHSLRVELGERGYDISIAAGLAGEIGKVVNALAKRKRPCVVLTDENVARIQEAFFQEAFGECHILALPPGEKSKSLKCLGMVYDFLCKSRIDRNGCLFAVGGGVTGDLGGFAAATYLRGIGFYQVPTTLLAMVDSSVGGKTGINLEAGKNLAGAFYQPREVYIDTALLETLPAREFAAGMAEVIKYGMLSDSALFDTIEASELLHAGHSQLPGVIHNCCAIKAAIVKADETEQAVVDGRALLNLGHTFAHAIETVTAYGEYAHGEAVAVGLVLASRLSQRLGSLDESSVNRVCQLIERYELPGRLRQPLKVSALCDAMKLDKKVKEGKPRFVILKAIGEAVIVDDVSEELISELWIEAGAVG